MNALAGALIVILIGGGIATYAIGARSERGTLDRNLILGVRLPSTLRSDSAWSAAQRAAAPLEKQIGVLMTTGGILAAFTLREPAIAAGFALFVLLVAVVLGVRLFVVGHRAAREVEGNV